MKSYTDIEQSMRLAEFLSPESADMWYSYYGNSKYNPTIAYNGEQWFLCQIRNSTHSDIPCWSLAALLSILPFHLIVDNKRYAFNMIKGLDKNGETYAIKYAIFNTTFYFHLTDFYNNPVDACVAMIEKLHEQNLL